MMLSPSSALPMRPSAGDAVDPRRRSNLTMSRAQHPHCYVTPPFATLSSPSHARPAHRPRLIQSAPVKPRSGAHVAAAAQTARADASDDSGDVHAAGTGNAQGSPTAATRRRPLSGNPRWVFLTQETLHPAFTMAHSIKRRSRQDEVISSSSATPRHLPHARGSGSSGGGGGAVAVAAAAASAEPRRHEGRPPLSRHAHVAPRLGSSTVRDMTEVTQTELALAGKVGAVPTPSTAFLHTLERAVKQGGALNLQPPMSLTLLAAVEAPSGTPSSPPAVSLAAPQLPHAVPMYADKHQGAPTVAAAATKSPAQLVPTVLSDEEHVAAMWARATVAEPLSAGSCPSQRQACVAPTGLLVDGSAESRALSSTPRIPSEPGPGWTAQEYAEARSAVRRVTRHLPARPHSVLAERLRAREEWCARALHSHRPVPVTEKGEAVLEEASTTASRRAPVTTTTPERTPPTWIPLRPASRPSSVLSGRPPPTSSEPTSTSAGTPCAPPTVSRLPPLKQDEAWATSPLANDALRELPPVPSDTASVRSSLPSLTAYAHSAAIQAQVPNAASADELEDVVLTELPTPYAQALQAAARERQAYYLRDASAAASQTLEPSQKLSERGSIGAATEHVPSNGPPRPTVARQRVSWPFSRDEDLPLDTRTPPHEALRRTDSASTRSGSGGEWPVASEAVPRRSTAGDVRGSLERLSIPVRRPSSQGSARLSVRFAPSDHLTRASGGSILAVARHGGMGTPVTPTSAAPRANGAVSGSRLVTSASDEATHLEAAVSDLSSSEDSEQAGQRRAKADASIAVYQRHLHSIIAAGTEAELPEPARVSPTTATAGAGAESAGQAALDFAAQSRLNHLAARFQNRLAKAAKVHHYATPAERDRLLALADAFAEQRLQQIVPRLHPISATEVSELDPWRRRAEARREDSAEARSAQRRRLSTTSATVALDDPCCGGMFPLTEAWRRADARAAALEVSLLHVKRGEETSVGARRAAADNGADAVMGALLSDHQRAVAQAEELQSAMEKSFTDMVHGIDGHEHCAV